MNSGTKYIAQHLVSQEEGAKTPLTLLWVFATTYRVTKILCSHLQTYFYELECGYS